MATCSAIDSQLSQRPGRCISPPSGKMFAADGVQTRDEEGGFTAARREADRRRGRALGRGRLPALEAAHTAPARAHRVGVRRRGTDALPLGPVAALAPVSGAIADRFETRRVLIVSSVAQAVVAASLALAVDSVAAIL